MQVDEKHQMSYHMLFTSNSEVLGRPKNYKSLLNEQKHRRRPTWLTLLLFFLSKPILRVWKRLTTGILVGLVCDSLTGNLDYAWLDAL